VTMSLVAFGGIVYALLYLYYMRENRKRARGDRDAVMEGLSEGEIVALGEENPRFQLAA